MLPLSEEASGLARIHLADSLPRRWRHVRGVAAKAEKLAWMVGADADVLIASAWLHDIGYAPGIADTGFHSLDGGRWLLRQHFDRRIAALVAHHSCASFEAEERGLADELAAEFPREESAAADALWFADMTTGPDGEDLTVGERLAEIRNRYGPQDLVTRFWKRAEGPLMEAVKRTQARLTAQPM
ncbi:HD domain-containing protein [Micromonospora marina]|uniref:HD domain-containing protein n=1 Tax=Micromonospora marina TaxID=307120 RepID=UPI003453300F